MDSNYFDSRYEMIRENFFLFRKSYISNRQHNNQNFGREIIHTTMYIKIQNYNSD
jgi:hypothetical protein